MAGIDSKLRDGMPKITVKESILGSIKASSSKVLLRIDFNEFGGQRQVSRAIKELINEGILVRVGYGIYVTARPSVFSGRPIPVLDILSIGFEVMKRLGIKADGGKEARALRDGLSTQVPMLPIISVGKSRIRRKIAIGRRQIVYEKD